MATKHKRIGNTKICLLGPSFDTGNLGVSTLAESSIKVILNRWPDAEVTLLGSGSDEAEHRLELLGRQVSVKSLPIRFCRNVLLPNHFAVLALYALLFRLFQRPEIHRKLASRNLCVKTIVEADMIADITGGDSFSDIYGVKRFITGFLRKWLAKVFRKRLVFLPQTYGPFKRWLTRRMARSILDYADVIYSRDCSGVDYVGKLLRNKDKDQKVKFVPDLGFILDPRRPRNGAISSLEEIKATNAVLVGLNVSGLVARHSNAAENMFNLQVDYLALINSVIELLMGYRHAVVLLVPHVLVSPESEDSRDDATRKRGYEQSDATACRNVYNQTIHKYNGRIFLVDGHYDHKEAKYIIGLCDFFIGSRMHACIAALSQCIPAVGLAYSKKFIGVFESVGLQDLVVDLRRHNQDQILRALRDAFEKRATIADHLRKAVPDVQAKTLNMLKDFE